MQVQKRSSFSGKRSLPIEKASTDYRLPFEDSHGTLCVDLLIKNQNARVEEKSSRREKRKEEKRNTRAREH